MKNYLWRTGSGRLELTIPIKAVKRISHLNPRGDILKLSHNPFVREQLDLLNPETVKEELEKWTCDLGNHEKNLQCLLWIAHSEAAAWYKKEAQCHTAL